MQIIKRKPIVAISFIAIFCFLSLTIGSSLLQNSVNSSSNEDTFPSENSIITPNQTKIESSPTPIQTSIKKTQDPTAEPKSVDIPQSEPPQSSVTPNPTTQNIPSPDPTWTYPEDNKEQTNYSVSISKAIQFFESSREPQAILWLDVMYRRFRVSEFNHSLQRFDELVTWYPEDVHTLGLFRRIADYYNPFHKTDFEALTSELDQITVPALYCDRYDLPLDYPDILREAISKNGYHLTHVLLAWIWIQENKYEIELESGFVEDLVVANSALINSDSVVTDLELEAAAFLYLAGRGDLVDASFIENVIESQGLDGGWGEGDNRWHSTILGLLLLLHAEFPADSYPPVLAQPST